ncbi:MAG: hypothetical protein ACYDHX_10220 [Methanothrix sp.]
MRKPFNRLTAAMQLGMKDLRQDLQHRCLQLAPRPSVALALGYLAVDLPRAKEYDVLGFRTHNVASEDDVGDIENDGTVTLSEDGQKMTGTNDYGVRFTGIKQTPNTGTSCEQTNLALHKLASQSSTATDWGGNWDASRGVDGVKTGNIFDGGFHTDDGKNRWWWA